jgi:hypothetical protein
MSEVCWEESDNGVESFVSYQAVLNVIEAIVITVYNDKFLLLSHYPVGLSLAKNRAFCSVKKIPPHCNVSN